MLTAILYIPIPNTQSVSDGVGKANCKCPEGECICIEHGDIYWQTFLDTVAGLASPTFESVIAELIDNSLDWGSTYVEVEQFGSNDEDFAVIVYDNGTGIEDDAAMKKAFSLAHLKASKPSKKESGNYKKTGKFNFGLKISPISRCHHISMMSMVSGSMVHRRLDKKQVERQENYGTISSFLDCKAVVKARERLEDEKDKSLGVKTAVVLSGFKRFAPSLESYKSTDYYKHIQHLTDYYGILFQKALLDQPDTKIRLTYPGSKNSGKNVLHLDPFWKDFTPDKIDERLAIKDEKNPDFIEEGDRYILESFKEWGTISTGTIPITYKLKNASGNLVGEYPVNVTGYCIPSRTVHSRLKKKWKNNVFDIGQVGSPSNLLGATKLGGIYFYREGRLIAFGDNNKDPDANQGWYDLLSSVESRHSIVRIEIEVPVALDYEFGLTGSKDKYTPPKGFMTQLKTALRTPIQDSQLRANIGDGTRSFWITNAGKDSPCAAMTSVREASQGQKGKGVKINKDCEFCNGEPKPWHHISTVCPKKACEICGRVGECIDGCDYECDQCGENHKETDCHLNCPYCEYPEGAGGHPEGEQCPHLCEECGELNCTCPCPKGCGKDKSHCDGDCDDGGGTTLKAESTITHYGDAVLLKLERHNSGDKTNKELIEEAIVFLNTNKVSK